MSYSGIIRDVIYETITNYNKIISEKYGISNEELMNMFFEDYKKENKKEIKQENKNNELNKKSKKELQEMCIKLDINDKGNKKELIERIQKGKKETVVDKIKTVITSIIIKKNKFDNYEHEQTGFVFNKTTKCVIGKQSNNGDILQLDDDDIEICKQYKFKFNIPENLDCKVVNYEDELDEEDDDEELDEEDEEDDEEEIE
tara:strand:+ start:63 stop:665 length:603 start_codon:yes stop_codon:yes gene_type:complete